MKKKNIKTGFIIIYIVLILGVAISVLPFLWMLLTSFKTQPESVAVPIQFFPSNWNFDNYFSVWVKRPFGRMFLNTVLYVASGLIAQLSLSSMAAYAYARIHFPGKNVIFMVLMGLLMVPGYVYILPQYQIIQKLGLLNTFEGMALPNLFSIFATFMFRQFFLSLPDELEEAARLDGCNHFLIYSRIMLPLIRSGLVAQGILTMRAMWNDLMWPMVVNNSADEMTLAVGLAQLQGETNTINYPELMAAATMATIPLVILYAIFQKQFIEGVANSGIKG